MLITGKLKEYIDQVLKDYETLSEVEFDTKYELHQVKDNHASTIKKQIQETSQVSLEASSSKETTIIPTPNTPTDEA